MNAERKHLHELIEQFQSAKIHYEKLHSTTPIQIVVIPGNEEVKKIAALLQDNNLDVRPILYPTVPKGKERLRIVLHEFNDKKEVEELVRLLNQE